MRKSHIMEENRKPLGTICFLWSAAVMIIALAGVYGICTFRQIVREELLRNLVMTVIGVGVTGNLIRQGCLEDTLDYDNRYHPVRFWCCFLLCLLVSLASVYLPVGGWPYVVIFITLALFSNGITGITAAAVLLMVTVFLHGADLGTFMMYFVSGLLGVSMFRKLDTRFKVGIPVWISMMVLIVCETANLILFSNEQLNMEMFVIPAVNVLVSSILLIGLLKLFSALVIYKYRLKYLELTDPENSLLCSLKEKDKQEYYQCMHTAYFCDRIARRLDLDAEAVKTAGYYHKIDSMLDTTGDSAQRDKLLEPYGLPPKVRRILWEYWKGSSPGEADQAAAGSALLKETAILVFADAVITSVLYMFSDNKSVVLDYDKIIDVVFRKKLDSGLLNGCAITQQELTVIKSIFKEEKLYYDFLR